MAVALDHAGMLGVPQRAITGGRMLGIALVIIGALLVRKY